MGESHRTSYGQDGSGQTGCARADDEGGQTGPVPQDVLDRDTRHNLRFHNRQHHKAVVMIGLALLGIPITVLFLWLLIKFEIHTESQKQIERNGRK